MTDQQKRDALDVWCWLRGRQRVFEWRLMLIRQYRAEGLPVPECLHGTYPIPG